MRKIHTRTGALASVLWGTGLFVLLAAMAGCGADGTLAPERTWEEVRYHRNDAQGDDSYGDLVIGCSGEVVYELQGMGASSRGLLAGENLETLARLIDALPPADFSGQGPQERSFFLSVRDGGTTRNYHGDVDDPAMPSALQNLVDHLEIWIQEFMPKPEALEFRILAEGEQSGMAAQQRRLVRDRDALVEILDILGSNRPLLLPAIDFRTETVVAIFLGERPSTGYAVDLAGAGLTEGGKIILAERWIVPGEKCPIESRTTTPYLLAAISTSTAADMLANIEIFTQQCGTLVSTDGL